MYARQYVTLFGRKQLTQQVAALFYAGEQGAWFDPSDFATMFQDSAGTTPVTAIGDPVGRILDKSGRGNHATQGTAASRPVLQQDALGRLYLALDGVDDSLATASMVWTGTDKMFVCAGLRKNTDAATGWAVNLNSNAAPSFRIAAPQPASGNFQFAANITTEVSVSDVASAAPVTAVITGIADAAVPSVFIRKNGILSALSSSSLGTGHFGTAALHIGQRSNSTTRFNGRIYGLIIRGAVPTGAQVTAVEAYMNSKTGA